MKLIANELTGDRSLRFVGCLKEEMLKKSPVDPGFPSDRIALGSNVSSCLLGVLNKVFFPKGRKTDLGDVPWLGTNETEEHHFPL